MISKALLEYFRCPERYADFALSGPLCPDTGYFRVGPDTTCYGRTSERSLVERAASDARDLSALCSANGSGVVLPFDPTDVAQNLRLERYTHQSAGAQASVVLPSVVRAAYYFLRPALPVVVRKHLQRLHLRDWQELAFPHWPVDHSLDSLMERVLTFSLDANRVDRIPFIWFWPHGAPSCAIVTHDVEALRGRDFCSELMDLDDEYGIKASFQLVPEKRYPVTDRFLDSLRDREFEINIHDLNHDGRLFAEREEFLRRADKINGYAEKYNAAGFRSGALYRNADWYDALKFTYDMSIPNVAHLDPQRGGCCTVMPYFIGRLVELPVTATQDYTLIQILGEYSMDLWKRQIALIVAKHGLVSFIIHPDYFISDREQALYRNLLAYLVRLRAEQKLWIARPGDVARWWKVRSRLQLVQDGSTWCIRGSGSEQARLAFASLDGQRLVYELAPSQGPVGGLKPTENSEARLPV
jgi:hypothetical protein